MFFKVCRLKSLLPFAGGCAVLFMLILYPSECMQAAKDGLNLSLYVIFPSLFPFMVAARYLVASGSADRLSKFLSPVMKNVFGMPASASICFFLGVVSGYPVGASVTAEMVKKGALTKEQGEHLLPFCSNAGPLFVIGAVGVGMLASPFYGYLLYFIHLASAVLTGFLLKGCAPDLAYRRPPAVRPAEKSPFTYAVSSSVTAILHICGYIIFFSVILAVLSLSGVLAFGKDYVEPLLKGCVEITTGINNLILTPMNTTVKMSLISAVLALSGLCILFQTKDAVDCAGLSVKKYVLGKLMFALIAFFLTFLIFTAFPQCTAVFASMTPQTRTKLTFSAFFWLSLIPSLALLLLSRKSS